MFLILALAKFLHSWLKPRGSHGTVACLYCEKDQAVGGEAGRAYIVPLPGSLQTSLAYLTLGWTLHSRVGKG